MAIASLSTLVDYTNKFLHVEDYDQAQRLLDEQLDARWPDLLDGLRDAVFPDRPAILMPHLSYYWSLWQSEWATERSRAHWHRRCTTKCNRRHSVICKNAFMGSFVNVQVIWSKNIRYACPS